MPDGPEPGTPEYDWLYGKRSSEPAPGDDDATRVVPRTGRGAPPARSGEPRPDETRVMPVMPPSARGQDPDPTQVRRQPPAPAPAPTGGSKGGTGLKMPFRRPSLRPRFRLRWLWTLLLLWLVFLIAVPFFALSKVDHVDAFPSSQRPADQGGTTYLLVGSDSRKGLSAEQRKELHTGGDVGQRTDTIILIHTGSGPSIMMSIPRDSIVPIPGHGTTKINAAFAYGGPKLLVQTIEQDTGIRIDHYVELGFGGFVNVVDAVGGITICPDHAMDDKLANLHVKAGCQHADGRLALAYARSRHADPQLGDIARGDQQREVITAVGHKALSPWTFINPFRYWGLNMAASDSLTTDQDMGTIALGKFAWTLMHPDLSCVVPISDLAVHWDPTRSKQVFRAIADDNTDSITKSLCTKSGLPAQG